MLAKLIGVSTIAISTIVSIVFMGANPMLLLLSIAFILIIWRD